jgi:two-component system, NarL family, nitrate/nitrite response regulator NarL
MRVVIADDHTFYREGLARLLRKFGVDVVGEAADGEAAVRMVEETSPDVVLLDLRMPSVSGLDALRMLTEHSAATRVLVLSVSADEADVTEAIAAGANGYVLKDEPVEEVIAGIRAAASGGARISPGTATALLGRVRGAIEAGEDLAGGGLSTTELQVLDLVAAGKPDREVSERLSIGEGTVGDYVRSIVTKLQVENRVREARHGGSG